MFSVYSQMYTLDQGWCPVVQKGGMWVPAPTASAAQIAAVNKVNGVVASTPVATAPVDTFDSAAAYQQAVAVAPQVSTAMDAAAIANAALPASTSTADATTAASQQLTAMLASIFGAGGVFNTSAGVASTPASTGTDLSLSLPSGSSSWLIWAAVGLGAFLLLKGK